jgi:hypothetical protein
LYSKAVHVYNTLSRPDGFVRIYESESATLMATRHFRFAKPERVVSSQCSFTSTHGSTAPQEMSLIHLSHAPSHLAASFHLILLITCQVTMVMLVVRQK